MTRYILLLILLFTALYGNGQTSFEDWKKLGEAAFLDEDYPKALDAMEHAESVIPKKTSPLEKAEFHNNIGVMYFESGDYKKGVEEYDQALKYYQLTGIDSLIAESMYNLGVVYKDLGLSHRSMHYLLLSARIFERNNNLVNLARAWNSMGNVYRDAEEFEKAIDYHLRALQIRRKIVHEKGIADSYQNLGSVYLEWKKYNQAEYFLKKALQLKKRIHQPNIVTTYSSLGRLYVAISKPQTAQTYLTLAYELRMAEGNSVKTAESLLYLANYYVTTGELTRALELFQEVEHVADTKQNYQLLVEALEGEISVLEQSDSEQILTGKYKKLLFSKEKASTEANKKEVDRLEISYDVERKTRELALRRKQSRIAQLHFRQLLFVSAAILLVAMSAWVAYYYIRRSKRKIERQKEEIEYLHYELSHRTKNYFALLSGMLALDRKKAKHPETVNMLDTVKRRLEAMSQVQHYLLDDSSRNNKEVDLGAYFSSLTNALLVDLFTFRKQPQVMWELQEVYLDYDKAMRLAIVLNELICNAVEHGLPPAGNPELHIAIYKGESELRLVVKDNGMGINTAEIEKGNKKGIDLMEKLLHYLHGTLAYTNENGCVATVRIQL